MRNTDPIEPERFHPLGSPTKAPAPPSPVLKPSQGPYGIVIGEDGKMRTTQDNLPKSAIEAAMDAWYKAFNVDCQEDYE